MTTVSSALKESNLSPSDVVAVDIVGGGSRIPWVAAALEEAFADPTQQQQQQQQRSSKLRRTLDGGSSVAMGAAMFAAGLNFVSPSLDAKQMLSHISQENIQVRCLYT